MGDLRRHLGGGRHVVGEMLVRFQQATESRGPTRLLALLLPGFIVAVFVIVFVAVTKGAVTGGAVITAVFGFIVFSWVYWRGSQARRFDLRAAQELSRQGGWTDAIEFAGRPAGANVIWRGTVWIATDRRLVEASRPRWWRRRQPASPLRSIGYEQITGIRPVRTAGGGETPRTTTVVLALGAEELKLQFSPRRAKEILASVTKHTGLIPPLNHYS
jgi:hypothetical protein